MTNVCVVLFLPIERKYKRTLRDDQFIIDTTDKQIIAKEKINLSIIIHNLRSAFNVGAIFRTAECIGVAHIYIRYTATPEEGNTSRTTMGTSDHVAWSYHKSVDDVISILKEKKIPIVALETVKDSKNVYEFKFPTSGCALLLGNERFGIEADMLENCDHIVSIPCLGVKNSLNVGVAMGVCCYEILRQWKYTSNQ